ncbi:phosphatase PAP2 family protein [Paractinoplanes maris]|uniref:phosphatase PAP2 family protein n=1 Tax=Paractinoplanes maris TaxID=1734446 RepID=UPI002020232F|nr:phosphatase PAP2 family protein [Actinoplanes maris]
MTVLASPQPASATPARASRHLLAPAGVAVLATLAVVALYQVAVRSTLGQQIDTIVMRGADVHHPQVVGVLERTLNGTSLISLVLVCVFAAVFGALRRRLDLAIGATLLVIGANATTQLLKTQLPRPDLDGAGMSNSFPSGHTTAAASVAFAVILVLPQALRGMVALVGFGYVTVIAVATVWAEWHRPSDTVAALMVSLAWGAFAVFVTRLLRPVELRRPSRVVTLPLLLTGAVTAAAGLLGLAAVALSERAMPDLVSGRFAFLAGSAAVTAAAAGAFLIWARLTAASLIPAPATPADAPARTATKAPAKKKSGVLASAGRRVKGGTK